MKIPASIRAAAVTARNAIARVGDQTGTVTLSLGGLSVVVWNPRAVHQAPAVDHTKPVGQHVPAAPCRCLACRAGRPAST